MAKENKNLKLAEKIIKKFAKYEAVDDGLQLITIDELGHKQLYYNTEEQDVVVGGIRGTNETITEKREVPVKTSKSDAAKLAAADVASKIDAGEIVLSDTWVEDNLSD